MMQSVLAIEMLQETATQQVAGSQQQKRIQQECLGLVQVLV